GITSMGVVDALWDVGGFVGVAMAAWWIGRLMRVARLTPGPTGGDLRSTRRG
ncbi:MAG: CPBP family intramembrane metalloprotease, partial [Acidipropionibacterium jensenii]|nr:CPBP family intramembrane metalloprotease [Acidipropionibacterium jensenii]